MEITREKRDMALHAWEEANSKYNNAGRDVGPIGWRALKKQRDEALDEFTKWQKELTTAEQREKISRRDSRADRLPLPSTNSIAHPPSASALRSPNSTQPITPKWLSSSATKRGS